MSSSTKYLDYYESLRSRILNGGWCPGDRLPNRVELRDELNTSLATVQKVLDRLREDGFVRPRGRAGTFVSDRLPAQYRIGVALPAKPEVGMNWSRMWQALEHEAQQINALGEFEVRFYYGLRDGDAEDRERLAADLRNQTLGGVFWTAMTSRGIAEYEQLRNGTVPVLAMTGDAEQNGYPSVRLVPYLDRTLDYLASTGRSKIGLINSHMAPSNMAIWQAGLARRGLVFDPYRCMSAHPVESDAVRVAVYHMVRSDPEHRPDALLVVDDHMVEPVTRALRDAGCRAPEDVLVVAHCNYPLPPQAHVPVKFIGFDLAALLDRVVAWLLPTAGADPAGATTPLTMEAKFDHELPQHRRYHRTASPVVVPRPVREAFSSDQYLTVSAFD